MDKQVDGAVVTSTTNASNALRRLSQIKVLARLVEHELATAKSSKDVTLDREIAENILDTLEVYIDDFESAPTSKRNRQGEPKPSVTRLN